MSSPAHQVLGGEGTHRAAAGAKVGVRLPRVALQLFRAAVAASTVTVSPAACAKRAST